MPPGPRSPRKRFPLIPWLLCSLGLLAALLYWKGSVYAEAVDLRRFLDLPLPVSALAWWWVSALLLVLISLGIGWLRWRK